MQQKIISNLAREMRRRARVLLKRRALNCHLCARQPTHKESPWNSTSTANVESLSTYARQFLQRMDKPDVDMIEGLLPANSHPNV